MTTHHPEAQADQAKQERLKAEVQAAREWLLGNIGYPLSIEHHGAEVVNKVNDILNASAIRSAKFPLDLGSSVVARALIARGILHVAAQWLSDETGMPAEVAYGAVKSLMDELPAGMEGGLEYRPHPEASTAVQ